MDWVKFLIKVGLIPIKQNANNKFEFHFLNMKYLALNISHQLMFGVVFYFWLNFYHLDIVGIIKTIFFFVNINGGFLFYMFLSLIIKNMQGKAVNLKCKVIILLLVVRYPNRNNESIFNK